MWRWVVADSNEEKVYRYLSSGCKEFSGIWASLNTGLCRTYTLLQLHVEKFFEGGDLVTGLAKSIERFQSGEAGGNLKLIYMTRSR